MITGFARMQRAEPAVRVDAPFHKLLGVRIGAIIGESQMPQALKGLKAMGIRHAFGDENVLQTQACVEPTFRPNRHLNPKVRIEDLERWQEFIGGYFHRGHWTWNKADHVGFEVGVISVNKRYGA